jgi:hypothetical protein
MHSTHDDDSSSTVRHALATAHTRDGRTLLELSEQAPHLLIFLRHFG